MRTRESTAFGRRFRSSPTCAGPLTRETLVLDVTSFAPSREQTFFYIRTNIHNAIATINTFSSNDTNPSGTLLFPPTHAHFSERFST